MQTVKGQKNDFSLSKSSNKELVKKYFNKILVINRSGEDFPINLEEVWPLNYAHKADAVKALKKDFIKDIDYKSLRQNPERGASSPTVYYLTLSCMEFFIARKVRPVFEVYRQVFHNAINGISLADRKWTPYRKFITEMGVKYSPYSLAARRGNHPSEFLYINSTWYISAEYADYLRKSMDVTGYKETFRNKKFMLNKKNGR